MVRRLIDEAVAERNVDILEGSDHGTCQCRARAACLTPGRSPRRHCDDAEHAAIRGGLGGRSPESATERDRNSIAARDLPEVAVRVRECVPTLGRPASQPGPSQLGVPTEQRAALRRRDLPQISGRVRDVSAVAPNRVLQRLCDTPAATL